MAGTNYSRAQTEGWAEMLASALGKSLRCNGPTWTLRSVRFASGVLTGGVS